MITKCPNPLTMAYEFHTVDVFTRERFSGAQIAVVPEADGLDGKSMQLLAREFNLSESVFALPASDGDSNGRLRIFTPKGEIDFAGQALLAAVHVMAKAGVLPLNGRRNHFAFELNNGSVNITVDREDDESVFVQFSTTVKSRIDEYVPEHEELAEILSLTVKDIGCMKYRVLHSIAGINYLMVPIRRFECVRRAVFDLKAWGRSSVPAMMVQSIVLFTNHAEDRTADFHVRLMGPDIGVREDPPIGAAIPAFTAYLCAHKHLARGTHTYVAERGLKSTRQSLLSVEMDHNGEEVIPLRVGGPAVMVSSGVINI